MEIRTISKYVRISPQKTRLVADEIRGKNALKSLQLLRALNKRAAKIIYKTLSSAVSNAKQKEVEESTLLIKKIVVDGGPAAKRFMPRAMGRATIIKHPTSHILIILSGKDVVKKTNKKEKKKKIDKKQKKKDVGAAVKTAKKKK